MPERMSINFTEDNIFLFQFIPTQLNYRDGQESVLKCLSDHLTTLNCTKQCYPVVFNQIADLEPCNDTQSDCIMRNMYDDNMDKYMLCLKPQTAIQYKSTTKVPKPQLHVQSNSMEIQYAFGTTEIEIKDEILQVSKEDFIGSVGGYLGLVLGFSIFAYISTFIEKLVKKVLNIFTKEQINERDWTIMRVILVYVATRPVQDTFEKYLDTDTFKILSEKSI